MFNMMRQVIDTPIEIRGKEEIRWHFNLIRQAFLDWNYMRPDEDSFENQRTLLVNLLKQTEHASEDI